MLAELHTLKHLTCRVGLGQGVRAWATALVTKTTTIKG